MPVTLAQAKVGMADKVDQTVYDEFRRGSALLDALTFDDAVSPGNRWQHLDLWLYITKNTSDCWIS